jgi:hypothetical protein
VILIQERGVRRVVSSHARDRFSASIVKLPVQCLQRTVPK